MLRTEYLVEHNIYVVSLIVDGKKSKDVEFFFTTEDQQLEFIAAFFRNPMAAYFAYNRRVESPWLQSMAGGELFA